MRKDGDIYEEKAAVYLVEQGYTLLARNQYYRVGEIDLIAEERLASVTTLVFIEVRKRDEKSGIEPEETILFSKQRRLIKAIQLYLLSYRGHASQVRIDLIGFKSERLVHRKDFIRL